MRECVSSRRLILLLLLLLLFCSMINLCFWSAATCRRFRRSRPVAASVSLKLLREWGAKPPEVKAVTGHRTPNSASNFLTFNDHKPPQSRRDHFPDPGWQKKSPADAQVVARNNSPDRN